MLEGFDHLYYRGQDQTNILAWGALRRADIWITMGRGGPKFRFASRVEAEVKGDADRLAHSPKEYGLVLGMMATHPCVQWADGLVAAPNGMIGVVDEIANDLEREKDVIHMIRPEGADRFDFAYVSDADLDLARSVRSVCILEDLSTTGSTVHAQAKLLRQANPALKVHSLSMLQRNRIDSEYQQGPDAVGYHTLCVPSQPIPLDYDGFVAAFGFKPTLVSPDYYNQAVT